MARKPVLDLDADKTVQFEKAGQSFEGYYLGFKNVKSDFGISKRHVFLTEEGNVGIWGSAKLDEKLAGILEESKANKVAYMTFITYQGKVKLSGGRTMKKYDVDFDDEITQDLGALATSTSTAAADTTDAEEIDVTEEAAEETEAEEAPAVRKPLARGTAPTFTKDHGSKVSSMLKKQ